MQRLVYRLVKLGLLSRGTVRFSYATLRTSGGTLSPRIRTFIVLALCTRLRLRLRLRLRRVERHLALCCAWRRGGHHR
jgi:hypothetical protein